MFQRAAELNPDEASAQYQLARALQAAGRKVEAARAFARARELKAAHTDEVTIPGVR
jgi:Flp pilus assembly protein TadD